jgi:hypothetical protein
MPLTESAKRFIALSLALLASGLCTRAQETRGTLAVWVVSGKADYIVIGADSRVVVEAGPSKQNNDLTCKIISLGGSTLFFETGLSIIGAKRGANWDTFDLPREVYTKSKQHDPLTLSDAWGTGALKWFTHQPQQGLKLAAEGLQGILSYGGFIGFDEHGTLSIHSNHVLYDATKHSLALVPSTQAPGQIGVSGVGKDLVREFVDGKTQRAIKAVGPVGMIRTITVTPEGDTEFVRKAIQFVMDNASPEDKSYLAGPIDIAVIRRDRTIRWVSRKPLCSLHDFSTQ